MENSGLNKIHFIAFLILFMYSITDLMDMNLGKLGEIGTGRPSMLQSMGSQVVGHDLVTEQQQKFIARFLRAFIPRVSKRQLNSFHNSGIGFILKLIFILILDYIRYL